MKTKALTLFFFSISIICVQATGYTGNSDEIRFNTVAIRVLTPTMFSVKEITHANTPTKTDLGITNLAFNKVVYTVEKTKNISTIKTDSLLIVYNPDLDLMNGGIKVVFRRIPKYALNRLNEKDTLNLGGVIGSLDNCKGDMKYAEQNDVSSKSELHPIPDGILSRRGFTVLKHTKDTLYLYSERDKFKELYVMAYADNYKQAFNDFYQLAGKIPLLPKWSLGFIYSRWKDYTADDYKTIVKRFRQEQIPIDAIILDMCWHVDYWYGYKYDNHNFANMKMFHDWTDSVHLKTGFNHHSGCIYSKDPHINEFCKKAGIDFNKALIPGLSWEVDKKTIHYDTRNSKHFKAFYDIYLSPLIKDGLDFHWVDGENSIYSSELYQKYLSEGTQKRPFVMNRLHTNVLCNHRYPVGFSGDTYISWETMSYSLEANIKGANNGVYWSHDIGGYMPQGSNGYPPSPSIFTRWLQLGAVSPIFRVHAKKDVYWTPPCKPGEFDQGSRLPWEWGDTVLQSARTAIQLRYKLLPYVYSMISKAHETGVPLCRGMYIDYPDLKEAYRYDQFMFGDVFLAAPILNSSVGDEMNTPAKRSLWLPKGEWYDYFSNQQYLGNQNITVSKSIYEFPLYVKAGSIIPMASYREYSGAALDTLLLVAYTPEKSNITQFSLYEDDGESLLFEKKQFRTINLSYEYVAKSSQKIVIHKAEGSYANEDVNRAYEIHIVNTVKPTAVYINGELTTNWQWDSNSKNLMIEVSFKDTHHDITIDARLL